MDYSNQNLSNADFSNRELTRANFSNSILTNADFSYATLLDANFNRAHLSGVKFQHSDLTEVSSFNNNDLQTQSIRKLPILILISLLLNWIFIKAVITDYQNHNLSCLTVAIAIALLCLGYLIYSFLQIVRAIKKHSGTCFQDADLSGAKFNYALIVNTDFTNAIITHVDWRNSRSKADNEETI